MGKNTGFPWDLLRADCLRLVCTQLVQNSNQELNYFPPARKEDMIQFLRDVQTRNLDAAVKAMVIHIQSQRKSAATHEATRSPGKRKSEHMAEANHEDEAEATDGYNTRYKGIKRVKVREATPERSSSSPRRPGRPRKSNTSGENKEESSSTAKKSRGRPRKSAPEGEKVVEGASAGASAETQEKKETHEKKEKEEKKKEKKEKDTAGGATESASTAYRGRGRPRKSDVVQPKTESKPQPANTDDTTKKPRGRPRKIQPAVGKPTSKVFFEGVVLEKRKTVPKEQAAAIAEPELQADSTVEHEEEDAVLAAVNAGAMDVDGASSLGGSNKENEPAFRYTPDDRDADIDADIDADGDPDGETEPIAVTATTATVTATVVTAAATTTTSAV